MTNGRRALRARVAYTPYFCDRVPACLHLHKWRVRVARAAAVAGSCACRSLEIGFAGTACCGQWAWHCWHRPGNAQCASAVALRVARTGIGLAGPSSRCGCWLLVVGIVCGGRVAPARRRRGRGARRSARLRPGWASCALCLSVCALCGGAALCPWQTRVIDDAPMCDVRCALRSLQKRHRWAGTGRQAKSINAFYPTHQGRG